MNIELNKDILDELLKNIEFKELYQDRCKKCFHAYEKNLYTRGSYLQRLDLFSYINNFISKEEEDYIRQSLRYRMNFRNMYVTNSKKINQSENIQNDIYNIEYEDVLKTKQHYRASMEDKKYFYDCSKILDDKELELLAKYYELEKYELDSYIEQGKSNKKSSKYKVIVDGILKIDDNDELIEFLKDKDFKIGTLRGEIHNIIVTNYNRENYDELYKTINSKLDVFAKFKKDENTKKRQEELILARKIEQENNLPTARKVINDFVNSSSENIGDFCFERGIPKEKFKKYIDIVKDRDSDLYEDYSARTEQIKKHSFKKANEYIKMLVDNIENGIEGINGKKRDFDIIDYYIGKTMDDKSIKEIAKNNLEQEEYALLSRFMAKNKILEKQKVLNIKATLQEKDEVDCKKDNRGFPIPGTGRVITEEEKLSIIDYLKENKVPLTNRTYSVARKRFLNNELFFVNSKNKVKQDN